MTKKLFADISSSLDRKSVAIVSALHLNHREIIAAWVFAMALFCGLRLSHTATPMQLNTIGLFSVLSYALIIAAPLFALWWASKTFAPGKIYSQPEIRLARYGQWRSLDCLQSREHRLFGSTGMMASLIVGMLLNVPLRSAEFLMAIPALGGSSPDWLTNIFAVMALDLVIMNSLYVIALIMAIRHVPWFPRFLVMIWAFDIGSQLIIASWVAAVPGLPLAVSTALSDLLTGNMQKVFISVVIWLPYLLLSDRVNVTYRGRVWHDPQKPGPKPKKLSGA